jgi:hypothetical protein
MLGPNLISTCFMLTSSDAIDYSPRNPFFSTTSVLRFKSEATIGERKTMDNKFEELARGLAQSLAPRRNTTRKLAESVFLASLYLLFSTREAPAGNAQILRGQVPAAVKEFGLKSTGRLPATDQLRLAVGLPLRNSRDLAGLLAQIYDPASPQYRHYLTPEQFTERFGPTEADYEAVAAFAVAHGLEVTTRYPNRVILDVSGSVVDIERAFNLKLLVYTHPTEARTFYAPDVEPSLDLAVRVLSLSGLNNYALPRPRAQRMTPIQQSSKSAPLLGSGPGGTYMGNDFRQAYAPNVTLDGSGQAVGLVEFDGFYSKDISTYESIAGLSRARIKTVLLDGYKGSPAPEGGNVEVALDIDMAMSMAPGLSQIIVYEAGPLGNWHDLLNAMATDNSAKQLSCSWFIRGGGPDATASQIFQQMAAQGQSFFNASGDADAYTSLISFPADNPYITQVGGTTLNMTTNGGSYVSETAWNWNTGTGTGGGSSTSYPIPDWQRNINLGANGASTGWRNVPDVAMIADNVFLISNNGAQGSVGGTSCGAPLWAGLAALVNQQAAAAGKPAVGFINPAVYSLGASPAYPIAFHDITTGNNTNAASLTEFFAVPGYDLCTGWGTPTGQQLITALAGTDGLTISGGQGFASGGQAGGPFSVASQTFTLANQGTGTLGWQAAWDAAWLSVSPSSGSLGATPVNVTVSLTPAANSLNAGSYSAAVWFTNSTSGFVQGRQFVLAIAQGSYGGAVMGMVPVAYWQLNETNAVPPADVVANAGSLGAVGNAFGLGDPVQGEPGIVGQSFRFSNTNMDVTYLGAHADVPFNPGLNPAAAFSVELWAMPAQAFTDVFCPAASVDASLNSGNSRFGWVLYGAATNWEFRLGAGFDGYAVTNDGGSVAVGEWNHVVGVYDGANALLYVNGQLAGGPIPAPGFAPNTNITIPLRIGATTFPNRTFDGWVDEVAFYGTALAADRILAHYNSGSSDPGSYAAEVLSDQPLGYWHLDEPPYSPPGPLPAAVSSGFWGSAGNGTYQPGSLPGVPGVPSPAFGANNTACLMNGSGYIDLPGWVVNFTGPLSVVLWTKAKPANGEMQTIASKGAGSYHLLLDGSGYPHFAAGAQPAGDLVGPTRIDDGYWHQLAGVYDGTSAESLYVDGQLVASVSGATNALVGGTNEFFIGSNPDVGLYELYNGVVDEICVFTNVLQAAQVAHLFSLGTSGLQVPPFIHASAVGQGTVLLTWSGLVGRSYQLQYKTNLAQTTWANHGAPITATASTVSVSDATTDSKRFYQVILLP